MVLKGTLVFCFGPNLKLRFWPRPKLNNKALHFFNVVMFILHKILHLFICIYYDDQER